MDKLFEIVYGLSGSGKSTLAKKKVKTSIFPSVLHIEKDNIRKMLFGHLFSNGWGDYKFQERRKEEKLVKKVYNHLLESAIQSDIHHIITSSTHLKAKERKTLMERFSAAGFKVRETFVNTPVEVCIQRDAARVFSVGEDVIRFQEKALEVTCD